ARIAMVAGRVVVGSAVLLAWTHAGSVQALVGTGYGSLVVTKALLLATALALAAFNLATARRTRRSGPIPALRARLPQLVEAEAIILVMIVLAASALSGQPPAP